MRQFGTVLSLGEERPIRAAECAFVHFRPCGFVAGVLARTDAARGVWKAPAGIEAS